MICKKLVTVPFNNSHLLQYTLTFFLNSYLKYRTPDVEREVTYLYIKREFGWFDRRNTSPPKGKN